MSDKKDKSKPETHLNGESGTIKQRGLLSRRGYLTSMTMASILGITGSEPAQASPAEDRQLDAAERHVEDEFGDAIVTNESTESVGPGVELYSFDQLDPNGWLRADVLTIDLGSEGSSTGLLSPGVSLASPVSELASEEDAIAGTNGDFFDIGNTNAPSGVEIGDGSINKSGRPTTIGAGADGLARIMDITLDGSVTLPDGQRSIDVLNESSLDTDEVGLYTPIWGDAPLSNIVDGASMVCEVQVVNGSVTSVSQSITHDSVPEDGYTLLGSGSGAEAILGLSEGDEVEVNYAASTDVPSPPEFAVGGNTVLLRDGSIRHEQGDGDRHPRTAAGISSNGSTMYLMTVDGRQRFSRGATYFELAALMKRIGAVDAINLDGGGSSTLVARQVGNDELEVRNSPSDGSERPVPNGIGVFTAEGNGSLEGVRITTRSESEYADHVFSGLSREFLAYGYDDSYAPVDETNLSWKTAAGSLGNITGEQTDIDSADSFGVLTAKKPGEGSIEAHRGGTKGQYDITVLDVLDRIDLSTNTLSLAGAESSAAIELIGYDPEGYRAPIEPRDIEFDYDESVVSVEASTGKFVVTATTDSGSTLLEAQVRDMSAFLPVTIGLSTETVSQFEDPTKWDAFTVPSIPASIDFVSGRTGQAIELTYDFSTTDSTRAAYIDPTPTIELPGEPQRIGLWVNGDGNGAWLRGKIIDSTDTSSNLTFASSINWTGWRYVEAVIPDGVEFPIQLDHIYPVEIASDEQYSGTLLFDGLTVGVPPSVERPDDEQVQDPSILFNGRFDETAWQFAVLADSQFTADNPNSSIVKQARRTLRAIRDENPEFLLINGDFVDRGTVPDLELAQTILNEEIGDSIPYYYLPGNHELEGTDSLSNFREFFGESTRTFDKNGTRFVLLNSATGSFRTSAFDQLLDLQTTLKETTTDDGVSRLIVVAHHPLDDPLPADNSQLGDRQEADLIKRWLRDFEMESNKETAYIGAHASVAHATHLGGTSYLVMPTSGKDPYGPPSNGGFTGWAMFGIADSDSESEWLQAEMRPHVDRISFEAPERIEVGEETTVNATVVQPDGRQIPLDYPVTVNWSGNENLFVGNEMEVADAIDRGKYDAVYDYTTDSFLALDPGEFSLTVETNTSSETLEIVVEAKIAYIEPNTTVPTVGEQLTFQVRDGTSNDNWIDSLQWEFGDGTSANGWWSAHRYDSPGDYQVRLIATDNTGQETIHTRSIEVSGLESPLARIEPSMTDIQSGEQVAFQVEDITDDDRWIASLEWEFGDGTSASGWWNAHRYDTPGDYHVRLIATDNTGQETEDEVTITVS